jgi:hypothetical protein
MFQNRQISVNCEVMCIGLSYSFSNVNTNRIFEQVEQVGQPVRQTVEQYLASEVVDNISAKV